MKNKKRTGFTVLECIISLLIMGLTIIVVQLVLPCASQLQNDSLKDTTDWYLFIERMESSQYQFSIKKVAEQTLYVKSMVDGKEYVITGGKNAVFMRTNQGGYMPLLLNYQNGTIRFKQISQKDIAVSAQLTSGERKNAIVCFTKDR